MPQEPIQLRTPMNVRPEAKTIMQRHGCVVEEGSVTLPMGSRRTLYEQYLETMTRWYDLMLPDQYRMLEAYDPQRHLSILYVSPE